MAKGQGPRKPLAQGTKTRTDSVNTNFGKNLRGVTGSTWKPTDVLHPRKTVKKKK